MARRKVRAAELAWNVTEHELEDARQLLTVAPDSPLWAGGIPDGLVVDGAIARLLPPADATDLRIEEVKALLEGAGAVAVKILPREQAQGLGGQRINPDEGPDDRTVRQKVHDVASRMASADHEALTAELDSAMDEVGL